MIKYFLIIFFTLLINSCFAQELPLKVGVSYYSPPYVMRGGGEMLYGFDVTMMQRVCEIINRDCQFKSYKFGKLLPAVVNNSADLAIGAITITPERAEEINFSIPYLPSKLQFVGKTSLADKPFSLQLLSNKSIGIVSGSVFANEIYRMGIQNPEIVRYKFEEDVIDALSKGKIDFALVDAYSAVYWSNRSGGTLKQLGKPMNYGFGLGIAINKQNVELMNAINSALQQYHQSPMFKKDYQMYFGNM